MGSEIGDAKETLERTKQGKAARGRSAFSARNSCSRIQPADSALSAKDMHANSATKVRGYHLHVRSILLHKLCADAMHTNERERRQNAKTNANQSVGVLQDV